MLSIIFRIKSRQWNTNVQKLQSNAISLQDFVNANEKKILYYSTPFIENECGQHPNVLRTSDAEMMLFPAFTDPSGLKAHMSMIGCVRYPVIKGNLKGVLDSLDAHPLLRSWGVVVDPQAEAPVELPPLLRVQPRCLR